MRIKLLALASACLFAMSATTATASLNDGANSVKSDPMLQLSQPLPVADVLAEHGLMSLDGIKHNVNLRGATYVAQTAVEETKSDVTATAAVAQIGTAETGTGFGGVGILLVLIAGGFMWLTLIQQRREN